ncbi:hypothetical protein [Cerasicoccus arenae]|uniref:Uncharacterized protein n=1 Tax=Cerasicoccus arenae TaxID=424488 RepID=A0A8J3GDY8_9BACT|nr:hypothetical protein [Cerasicoccus arenae]MBK1857492.1 hypothetical protein [Cerasicoccus arenae]GHB95335.1 hypothetical protein GCM10007047_08810 [Cerasicoccus arenae]
MKNLIIGCTTNLTEANVRPFLTSLKQVNFSGEVCLLINDSLSSLETKDYGYQINLVEVEKFKKFLPQFVVEKRFTRHWINIPLHSYVPFSQYWPGNQDQKRRFRNFVGVHYLKITSARYLYYYLYIAANKDRFSNVLLTDVRDVFFQADPFSYPTNSELNFFLEHPNARIGSCPVNSFWFRGLYGEEDLKRHSERRVSCSGTTIGTTEGILDYLRSMTDELTATNARMTNVDGTDQAAHNGMIVNEKVSNYRIWENGSGPILTLGYEPVDNFLPDEEGLVRNFDGSIIPIIHQYDRHQVLIDAMLGRIGVSTDCLKKLD